MSTSRNAPCPCGSGKKFKRCCELNDASSSGAAELAGNQGGGASKVVPILFFAAAIGVGVAVGTWRDAVADGLAVALALCVGVVMYLMARNPPEGTGRGGGAAINFGMDQNRRSNNTSTRSQNRSYGPPNRRSRRKK